MFHGPPARSTTDDHRARALVRQSPGGMSSGLWVWMKRLDAVPLAGVSLTCVEWSLATHFGVVPRDAFAAGLRVTYLGRDGR